MIYKPFSFFWKVVFLWKEFSVSIFLISFTLYQCSLLLEPSAQRMEGYKGKTFKLTRSSHFLLPRIYFGPVLHNFKNIKSLTIGFYSRLRVCTKMYKCDILRFYTATTKYCPHTLLQKQITIRASLQMFATLPPQLRAGDLWPKLG